MPFKEQAFFADVKREVVETRRQTVTAPKAMAIFTNVRAYLMCLKTFEIAIIKVLMLLKGN